jgi:tRNA(Ile)-lysidine synthase
MVHDGPRERLRGESLEVAARRFRYADLEAVRAESGASRVLTAHQRDDQVETVLLRLLSGSGLEGLAGIPQRRGALLRPLLRVPRSAIAACLAELGLEPVEDPTNRDLSIHRNFVRHALLPRLRAADPHLDAMVLAVRDRALAVREMIESRLAERVAETSVEEGLDAGLLLALPVELRSAALRWLLRRAGLAVPPSSRSMEAFLSSVQRRGRANLCLPGGRRALVARAGRVALAEAKPPVASFSYTFAVPGEIELAELGLAIRMRRSPVEPWMVRGDPRRAALAGAAAMATAATVRSRRAGDRLRPFGSPGERKLKELLIDRRIPAGERDRLPLLEIGGRIAWVPAVTIGDEFRLRDEAECWVVELVQRDTGGNGLSGLAVERVEKETC